MVNALTRKAGLTLGPIILETLVKHYFDRVSKEHESEEANRLRREELLYDEAFNIVKSFMEAATKHTVEELQAFSNTRTPSPPWVHVVRLLIPMSCCDEAATYVIKALGGEEVTKRVVGGTKWWQVRGVKGIDSEWIVAKKDWQEAKRKEKAREMSIDSHGAPTDSGHPSQEMPPEYQPEMDQMRCILYAHGGGYYFGSFDQERYSIQRLARKINGRVFAMNYRLAPQYPFPCAIQDVLAAYLYLIRPPPGSLHTPVAPSNIIFAGDSAGGGLCLAALQVVRDSGLPKPGGAVLISPWCDLTHSFPSVHLNTATDVIPQFGLSFHKPSTLWPPPPDHLTTHVQQRLRERVRDAVWPKSKEKNSRFSDPDPDTHSSGLPSRPTTPDYSIADPSSGRMLHLGAAGSVPALVGAGGVRSQDVSVMTPNGENICIDAQVHMYAPNYLLTHPLVSPVVSYLGGLPPLLVIASDEEVLRDEIIYLAHKAAHPDKYPVKPEARILYPALEGIEDRYGSTKVHLQVYDGCAHTLPILFAFTTPGKYCFRAMATFIKYVTNMLPKPDGILEQDVVTSPASTQSDLLNLASGSPASQELDVAPPKITTSRSEPSVPRRSRSALVGSSKAPPSAKPASALQSSDASDHKSVRRAFSASATRASSFLRRHPKTTASSPPFSPTPERESSDVSDVGGPRWHQHQNSAAQTELRHAGERSVYDSGLDTMIRERISTRGVVRPLEGEDELTAFRLPPELIGEISELAARRYVDGTTKFGKKFGKTAKGIEKARRRNIERAKQDTMRNMTQLHTFFNGDHHQNAATNDNVKDAARADTMQGLAASGSWSWAWALDADENPPPSSIVSRRDTAEARRLAKVADQAVFMDESAMSGNNLWSLIVNFLTVTPERDAHKHKHKRKSKHTRKSSETEQERKSDEVAGMYGQEREADHANPKDGANKPETTSKREKIVSRFARLVTEHRKTKGGSADSKANGQE